MEAMCQQTIDDLNQAWAEDERLELIDGEIVQRPMARFKHGIVQSGLIEVNRAAVAAGRASRLVDRPRNQRALQRALMPQP